jgi:hypothetical protein
MKTSKENISGSTLSQSISRRAAIATSLKIAAIGGTALAGAAALVEHAFPAKAATELPKIVPHVQNALTVDLVGNWDFNGNGSPGTLTIYSQDAQGNLTLKVIFQDVTRIDPWTGVWKAATRQITLTRHLPNNVTQTHVGYIGTNHPEIALIFGGSFTESDAGATQFGWYAKYSSGIII